MEEEKPKDEEIVTWKEIQERHPEVPMENLHKMVLVCKNCGHKDLLINFLKKNDNSDVRKYLDEVNEKRINPYKPKPYPYPKPKPWRPSPWKLKEPYYNKTRCETTMALLDFAKIEEYFFCPKCGSSLVCLSSEYSKNNLMRVL